MADMRHEIGLGGDTGVRWDQAKQAIGELAVSGGLRPGEYVGDGQVATVALLVDTEEEDEQCEGKHCKASGERHRHGRGVRRAVRLNAADTKGPQDHGGDVMCGAGPRQARNERREWTVAHVCLAARGCGIYGGSGDGRGASEGGLESRGKPGYRFAEVGDGLDGGEDEYGNDLGIILI